MLRYSVLLSCFLASAGSLSAQLISYPDPVLHYIYPAGGRQGDTVAVELGGLSGLDGAKEIMVEGPPGITVKDVKPVHVAEVRATLVIAKDAPPGRRLIRVVGGSNGLTNFRYFYVGKLPEVPDKEPNNSPQAPQEVTLPAVINGRLNPGLDVDCFSFTAQAGQKLVAAVLGHGMDSRLRKGGVGGFLDTSLELLDAQGKTLASAEDTLGLDPLIQFTIPAAGKYTVVIKALSYAGAAGAIYRLTLGDVPYPTFVFPPGGQRGQKVEFEWQGPNLPPKSRQTIALPDKGFPWHWVLWDHAATDGRELPFILGDYPEIIEKEPYNDRVGAGALNLPVTVNGRFDQPGDEDFYRVTLKKGQGILLEVTAQRHLRSPVDTFLEVQDTKGTKLAENDDGQMYAGQCEHDYPSADSRLEFTAPADGDYFIKIADQTQAGGPQAIYRLAVSLLKPGFLLHQWPDAVPIWGAGTTASFVVQNQRWGGLTGDIQLRIEGLPAGWKGSVSHMPAVNYYHPQHGLNQKALMTITAPADAPRGTVVAFRVIGRVEQPDGKVIEQEAQPLTLYGHCHTDRMHLRFSNQSRAAVAAPMDSWLETSVKELHTTANGTVSIPVKIHRQPGAKGDMGIAVDGETVAAGCAWKTPLTIKPEQNEVTLTFPIVERRPGTYGIVVSRSWSADLRAGRPGPCTPLILLHIRPAEKK